MIYFTDSHEWIKVEGSMGIVGISSHAQKELGEVVFIELPILDKHVKKGDEVAVLESTKAAADTYSPVSGKILEVNEKLKNTCSLINSSPEEEGWLYKIHLSHPQELTSLLSLKDYLSLIG